VEEEGWGDPPGPRGGRPFSHSLSLSLSFHALFSYNSPALWAKLEEREGLVRELVVLDGLCRELAG